MSGYANIDIDSLYQQIEEHELRFRELVSKTREQADSLLTAARALGESWSGSCMGHHNALYFGDFEKPGTIGSMSNGGV
jgi:hypothetical protein